MKVRAAARGYTPFATRARKDVGRIPRPLCALNLTPKSPEREGFEAVLPLSVVQERELGVRL